MIAPRIIKVEPVGATHVRVTFDDGFAGDYDLSCFLNRPAFDRIREPAVFDRVAVGEHGRSFGWFLDEIGAEIDFGADATRVELERAEVVRLAARHAARLQAAE